MAKVFANLLFENGRVYVKEYLGNGDVTERDFKSFDDAVTYALLRGFSIKTESQWATGCSMWFEA